jgi:hypothetical protein
MATRRNSPPETARKVTRSSSRLGYEDKDLEEDNSSETSVHERIGTLEDSISELKAGLSEQREEHRADRARQETAMEELKAMIANIGRNRSRSRSPRTPTDQTTQIDHEERIRALETAPRIPAEPAEPTDPATATAQTAQTAMNLRLRAVERAIAAGQHDQGNQQPEDLALIDLYTDRPINGYSPAANAAMIARVKTFLPRAKARYQVDEESRPNSNLKKQIRWHTAHQLCSIDDRQILPKVQAIEDELFESLVPYRVWPQRIIPLLKNDFQVVRSYLENNVETTWIETLVLMGSCLRTGVNLRAPWYTWIHMHPQKGEMQLKYANRIRDAFYGLSRDQQMDPYAREHLVRLIRDAFATVWGNIAQHQHTLRTAELINDLVARTSNGDRRAVEAAFFPQPAVELTLQGAYEPFPTVQVIPGTNGTQDRAALEYLPVQNTLAAAPQSTSAPPRYLNLISDPRTDDQTVSFAKGSYPENASEVMAVGDGNCHNCGKPGHWAKDCQQPQQARRGGYRQAGNTNTRGTSNGDFVTITGTLTGKMSRAFNAAKRPFQGSQKPGSRGRPTTTNRGGGRGGRRQFTVAEEDYEMEAMQYGVTTDNPAMMSDLMNDEEAWNQQSELDDYYENEA